MDKKDDILNIIAEGEKVLLDHLGLEHATKFWLAFRNGSGDYLQTKTELFQGSTVKTLQQEISKDG